MSVTDWSPQPSGNALADASVPARDGMAARDFPRALRGLMAKAASLALDQGGALVSSGFDNVYEVATNSGFADLKPGVSISFWADRNNTAEPFLNVDGTGPRRWLSADGLKLPAGVIQAGLLYTVAWNAALPGTAPAWRMVGAAMGTASTGLTSFDFSGTLAERAQYDAQPKGKVFLAVAETPAGPSWTLYIKRSNTFGDWSAGLPIKASPAQSTADAQAAADRAAAQIPLVAAAGAQQVSLAQAQAQEAASRALAADSARAAAEAQAAISFDQRVVATAQANAAAVSAIEARNVVSLIGAQVFDFSFDSEASPTDDWSN